jgi:serine phosphatase RsbU (regulator of sigma subunit)
MHCNCPLDIDINLARGVQQVLFPKSSPVCSWSCTGFKNRMAQGVGGDFFDIIPLPDGCQMVFIGDVTGHGLQAALVMALLYGYIHHAALQDCDPLRVAREINTFLDTFARRTQRLDYFFSATFFCGVINPETLKMAYVNAGHVPPTVRTGQGVQRLAVTGPPLGYFTQPGLGLENHQFVRGDRLLLVTDGIIEAFNAHGETFGRKRLDAVLKGHAGDHLEFLDAIFAALQAFGAEDPPRDDCTAMVIDLHGGLAADA